MLALYHQLYFYGISKKNMRNLVISGGSSGIGEAIIQKFLANNYVVYNLDIKSNLNFTSYPNYNYINCNVANEESINQAMAQINLPAIDIIIANAGKHLSANIEDTTSEQLYELLNLNLLGAYWLIQKSLPFMKQYGGSIITIGSDQSSIAKNNSAVYGMSKAALAHLTKSTALDYAKYNIRANCIGVGTVDTPLYQEAMIKYANKCGRDINELHHEEDICQPIGRIGQASEVAELAFFLAQDSIGYLTGALIPLDGGYTTR